MIVFQNRKFRIKAERIKLPNGETIDFASLIKRPGTNIIPFIDKETILMNYQYRPAIRRWIYQLAGGKVEESETPLQNARKELEEELGYRAGRMKLIGKFYSAPHISNDLQYVFVATSLKKVKKHLEKGELIRLRRIKMSDAVEMACNGKIIDAITIAGLMMFKNSSRHSVPFNR